VVKIFSIVVGAGACWVTFEYLIGKRNDVVELIAALSFLILIIVANFHLSRLEIVTSQNELHLIGWFGLSKKVINLSNVTDVYVERANSIDNHHSILIAIGKKKIVIFEKGGMNKQRIVTEIEAVYKQLTALTGISARAFYEKTNY